MIEMRRSLKQIFKYKKCLGILSKDFNKGGFYYLPTNDLGLFYEVMSLPSEEVDKIDIITRISIIGDYYIVYTEEANSCWDIEYYTMEEAIKDIIDREYERVRKIYE